MVGRGSKNIFMNKIRTQYRAEVLDLTIYAGVREVVGTDVLDGRIGERVWIYDGQYARRQGTAAEYIAIDQQLCTTLPDNTSFEIGACLGIPVMTSHRCVFADGDIRRQVILVTGGAGRVGNYATNGLSWQAQLLLPQPAQKRVKN